VAHWLGWAGFVVISAAGVWRSQTFIGGDLYIRAALKAGFALHGMQYFALKERRAKNAELLSIDTLGLAAGVDGAARTRGRHGLDKLPKVHSTAAGVVAEARAAAR